MDNLGLNNDVSVGGRKFHVQTNFSEPQGMIIANVFNEGEVIDSKEIGISEGTPDEEIESRMNDVHQELITEMEVLYYIYEKVKTVRHATSANKLAMLFLQKNLISEALKQFELALEIDPHYSEAYSNYGKALLIEESYDKAVAVLDDGVQKAPDYADIHNYLGIAHLRTGNYQQAIEYLEQAIKLNPNYFGAHYHLGIAKLGHTLNTDGTEDEAVERIRAEAMQHLETASERLRDKQIPNFDKVMEFVSNQSYQEAIDEFLQSKPKDILMKFMNFESEFYLKFMYGGKGKDDSFIADYVKELNELIENNPEYADVRNNLGVAHLIQCRNLFLKALDEFRGALRINPDFKKAEKNLKLAENDGKGFLILLRAILK